MGLDWLNSLMGWFGNLVPRVELLKQTHRAVKFTKGGKTLMIEPGLYVYWPLISEVSELPVVRQTITFNQRLTTKDDVTVAVSTVVIFKIDDIHKAIVDTWDIEDTISEASLKSTVNSILKRDFSEAQSAMLDNTIKNEITRACRSQLKQFGVYVEECFISDFTETTVFSHDGEGLAINNSED